MLLDVYIRPPTGTVVRVESAWPKVGINDKAVMGRKAYREAIERGEEPSGMILCNRKALRERASLIGFEYTATIEGDVGHDA